jgi:hypothetical protein
MRDEARWQGCRIGGVGLPVRSTRPLHPSPCLGPLCGSRQEEGESRGPYSASNASSVAIWASISAREAGVSAAALARLGARLGDGGAGFEGEAAGVERAGARPGGHQTASSPHASRCQARSALPRRDRPEPRRPPVRELTQYRNDPRSAARAVRAAGFLRAVHPPGSRRDDRDPRHEIRGPFLRRVVRAHAGVARDLPAQRM